LNDAARGGGTEHAFQIFIPVVEVERDMILPRFSRLEVGTRPMDRNPIFQQQVREPVGARRDLGIAQAGRSAPQPLRWLCPRFPRGKKPQKMQSEAIWP
jgi:hypothetical protein